MNWVMFEYILHAIQIDSHVSSLYETLNCKTCLVSGVCHDRCTLIYIKTSKCPYVVILIKPLAKCPLYLTRSEIFNYQHVFIVNLRVYFSVVFSWKMNYLPLVVIKQKTKNILIWTSCFFFFDWEYTIYVLIKSFICHVIHLYIVCQIHLNAVCSLKKLYDLTNKQLIKKH